MSCSVLNHILFSILLTICLVHTQVSANRGRPLRDRFKVQVQNHCDAHLTRGTCNREEGVFELQPNETTEWEFKVAVGVQFNITCQVRLLGTTKRADVVFFNSQRDARDRSRCFGDGHIGQCFWKVDETAVYHSNNAMIWIRGYNWSRIDYENTKENAIGALY